MEGSCTRARRSLAGAHGLKDGLDAGFRATAISRRENSAPGGDASYNARPRGSPARSRACCSLPGRHSVPTRQETVLILDYGSQYTQLIARRVRECRIYSEVVSPFVELAVEKLR